LPVAYDNVAAVIRSLLELVSVQAAQPRSSTAAV
jgi:hypothetical protein